MSAEPVQLDGATRFFGERYGSDATEIAVLGGGDWSRAFSFRLNGRDLVARFGLHLDDFQTDQKAMAFDQPALPIPAVIEIGEALGGYYAISERRFGRFLDQLDEASLSRAMPALLEMLDALRGIEPPGDRAHWPSDGPAVGWREWLVDSLEDRGGRTGGWRRKLDEVRECAAVYRAAEAELQNLIGICPEVRHLLHRDLMNRNVLVSEDAARLEAVFDWGCTMAGDFLYEVARLTFWAPWDAPMVAVDFRGTFRRHVDEIGLEVPDFEARLRCYELHIGLESIAYTTFRDKPAFRDEITKRTKEILASVSS